MARPSDREFALRRKIKDLEELLRQKEDKIKFLEKRLDKEQEPVVKSKKKALHEIRANNCPECGSEVRESLLPFGKLRLCPKCNWREVKK